MFKSSLHLSIFLFLTLLMSLNAKNHDKFVVVTPEKTGTHLLLKLCSQLCNKEVINCWEHTLTEEELNSILDNTEANQTFLHIHALPTPEIIRTLKNRNYKVCFLMRDPRDAVISALYYIEKGWAIGPCSLDQPYGLLSLEDKLHELISGERYGVSMVQTLILKKLPWMREKESFVYTTYFEKLVGAAGGGNDEKQLKEIKKIAKHLGIKLSQTELKKIAKNLWGAKATDITTFRKGQIHEWKEEFDEVHIKAFKKHFGSLLIHLKYEKDLNW